MKSKIKATDHLDTTQITGHRIDETIQLYRPPFLKLISKTHFRIGILNPCTSTSEMELN